MSYNHIERLKVTARVLINYCMSCISYLFLVFDLNAFDMPVSLTVLFDY